MAARFSFAHLIFFALLAVNVAFWFQGRDFRAAWMNVPPAPAETGASFMSLGDRQFSYRSTGIMLQNLGNTGGRATPLKDYDYKNLKGWLFLADRLDPRSNYMPFLAAYYFGGAQEGTDISPVIDYLAEIGRRPEGDKWRWLAQAVYLARFRQNDLNHALALAEELSGKWKEGRPGWMKQMPAFILSAQGDKKAAYELTMQIIKDESDKLHPEEINSMVVYMCTRLLDAQAAAQHPLCASRARP
ncbi:MAG TPA: hypothetical protein VIG74_02245 [Alphaproteobacteria bacterium]|jgi:hypothetical protein